MWYLICFCFSFLDQTLSLCQTTLALYTTIFYKLEINLEARQEYIFIRLFVNWQLLLVSFKRTLAMVIDMATTAAPDICIYACVCVHTYMYIYFGEKRCVLAAEAN